MTEQATEQQIQMTGKEDPTDLPLKFLRNKTKATEQNTKNDTLRNVSEIERHQATPSIWEKLIQKTITEIQFGKTPGHFLKVIIYTSEKMTKSLSRKKINVIKH